MGYNPNRSQYEDGFHEVYPIPEVKDPVVRKCLSKQRFQKRKGVRYVFPVPDKVRCRKCHIVFPREELVVRVVGHKVKQKQYYCVECDAKTPRKGPYHVI